MTLRAKLFHPATAIALLALVVAAGGTGWAAPLVGTAQLRAGAVTKAKLAPGSVTTPKLARNSVTAVKIASGAVTATKLARNAVRGSAIVDGAVTRSKLGPLAVDTFALNLGAVRAEQLGDGAVTTPKLGDGAATTPKLGDASVTGAKVAADAITADKIADGQVVEGAGRLLSNRLVLPDGTDSTLLLDVGGFGRLDAYCVGGAPGLYLTNGTASVITVVVGEEVSTGMSSAVNALATPLGPGVRLSLSSAFIAHVWHLQTSTVDAAGRNRVATLTVTSAVNGGACTIAAQGLNTG